MRVALFSYAALYICVTTLVDTTTYYSLHTTVYNLLFGRTLRLVPAKLFFTTTTTTCSYFLKRIVLLPSTIYTVTELYCSTRLDSRLLIAQYALGNAQYAILSEACFISVISLGEESIDFCSFAHSSASQSSLSAAQRNIAILLHAVYARQ